LLNLGRRDEGLADLQAAHKEKATPEHDVIDDSIRDQGDGYTVFSIPVGVVFRPNPNKIKNLQAKDYLGKARLISQDSTKYETFDGVDPSDLAFRPDERRPTALSDSGRPKDKLAASNPDGGAGLGRSSSDLGGTSAPRNPAGLSRAATTAVSTPSRPPVDVRRAPESLARANTTVRPVRPQSPPKPRSPELVSNPQGPVRGLSVRRPPPTSFKPMSPPVDTNGQLYDSYAPRPSNVNEWAENAAPGVSPSRAPSRSASAMGGRSQASYPSRSPSQYAVRRAPSRKGTIRSRGGRYEEEEGYVSGGGDEDVPFEYTKIRVRVRFLALALIAY
jgi:neutrophil factor 2